MQRRWGFTRCVATPNRFDSLSKPLLASRAALNPGARGLSWRSVLSLSSKNVRYLRSLGHHLQPVVLLGREGIEDRQIRSVEDALDTHELVKVRLPESRGQERKALARTVAERAGAEMVQVVGRTVLLYRARAEDPQIELPA